MKRVPKKISVKELAEAFADLIKLLKMFDNIDPNTERSPLIEQNVHGALSAYMQIYDGNHNRQTNMDIFLKRVAPSHEEP